MKKEAVNILELKRRNQAAILNLLTRQCMSRSDIARSLGLTRASAGEHIDRLMDEGMVCESGVGQIERGRKPMLFDIVPDYGYFAGIYLSREDCYFGLVDMKGCIILGRSLKDAPIMEPERVLENAATGILSMIEECSLIADKLIGVGFSVPGPVDAKNGVIISPPGFSHWHNVSPSKTLGKFISQPILIENNAASQTMAEMRFGLGRKYKSFLSLLVDSGIGGGIIINGRRVTGEGGFGAELGHTSIIMDGRLCACGNRGCLERYAAIPEILRDCFSPRDGFNTWQQVVNGAEKNDARCIDAIEREAHYLATAIVNYVNILEPQAIVLGGDLQYKPKRISLLLKEAISARAIMRKVHNITVLPSALEPNHHILSAAATTIDRYYEEGLY